MIESNTEPVKVIGEGAYGCIHKPSLHCKPGSANINSYSGKISKIMTKKHAKKEVDEYTIIANIDKQRAFYLGKPIECEPEKSLYNMNAIKKCKHANEMIEHLDDSELLVMKDGGLNIKEFSEQVRDIKNASAVPKMELFWIEFHRVLVAIHIFLQKGVLHFDMKPQNIVYDETGNRINIIDFGLTRNLKDVLNASKDSTNAMGHYHWSYPFETQFHNKAIYETFMSWNDDAKSQYYSKIIQRISDEKTDKTTMAFRNFFSFMIEDHPKGEDLFVKYMEAFYENMLFEMKPENYDTFIAKSLETFDSYGTGISIAVVLNNTRRYISKKMAKDLDELVFAMTDPKVFRRFTIAQSLHRFEEILVEHKLLEKYDLHFENHKIVKGPAISEDISESLKSIDMEDIVLAKNEQSSDKSKPMRFDLAIRTDKACPDGYTYVNKTRRCRKKCPRGYARNAKTNRCRKMKSHAVNE